MIIIQDTKGIWSVGGQKMKVHTNTTKAQLGPACWKVGYKGVRSVGGLSPLEDPMNKIIKPVGGLVVSFVQGIRGCEGCLLEHENATVVGEVTPLKGNWAAR